MAHNIDMTNNRANMAFMGSRSDIWHRLGQQMTAGMSIDQWATAAGLNWTAELVPALADLNGPQWSHIPQHSKFMRSEGWCFNVRSDNGHVLGYVSDGFKNVQPIDVLNWFDRYISVDSRFHLDCAGSLKRGEIIWATATYNGDYTVGGDKHKARLLMTTAFDGSGSTINKGTMIRVVCNNTLDASLADGSKAVVKTRHNTRFDPIRVGKELASIARSFDQYKLMGDAMAQIELSADQVSQFFKTMLDIPFDAKKEELSGKKLNQFDALRTSYMTTARETPKGTAWCALNAVTRWIDHERATRGGSSDDEARVLSSNFGSGASLKAKAVQYLTADGKLIEFLEEQRESAAPATNAADDFMALLKKPLSNGNKPALAN